MQYTASIKLQADERTWVRMVLNGPFATAYANFNLSDGSIGATTGLDSPPTTTLEDGYYICKLTATTNADGAATVQCQLATGNNAISYTGDGSSGVNFAWAQFELGSVATGVQAVTTAFDVTEAGFPTVWYLDFDGVDDFLDLTGLTAPAGPVTVFAGVRTDDGESSTNQFILDAATGRLISYAIASVAGKTAMFDGAETAKGSWASQSSGVLTFKHYASGGGIRANGASIVTEDVTELAIGGNVSLMANNSGSSSRVNGKLFSLIVRAASSTDAEIAATEKFIAGKSGVNL